MWHNVFYMKILLIFPRIEHGVTTYKDRKGWAAILLGYPAITLPHLAALTPRKHEVEIINENYDDIDFNQDVDLVGITCLIYKIVLNSLFQNPLKAQANLCPPRR